MFIATLIAAESIAERDISDAVARMDDLCGVSEWRWVEVGRVADIYFKEDPAWADGVLSPWFDRTDVAIQPAANREKKLLIADMDSTMITVECIDELADYAGIKPQIADVTERAMRGELDFASALDARVALLEGLEEAAIQRCLDERVTLMPGAKTLIQTMRARGATTILVSGGFTRFAEPVGHELGFHRMIANRLLIEDGRLTGKVRKPIVDATTKEVTLLAAIDELGIDPAATLAVGDGANDLPMIRRAGLGVAYHAKPIVAAEAAVRIDHNDLTALLHIQGIPRGEWVEG
ncbi:phosphoserine phosphatase [Sphingomonas sp. Leaf407]|uniref:phosphoserine phosphatase SerB n=1 Tax=unclassified Sphingomonas TaxID=196159 RepID=UPI0006F38A46|nr:MULTISPECIES: phosphoserine phosphatase SerB [unclassified Sphingomonas]KQN37688.1 phosphoserine phosphatase [Sphingomonas sp. Leaf42]KQT28055.1 phosphoserine phosphatase [Sphingomonas sp. Leaf407]